MKLAASLAALVLLLAGCAGTETASTAPPPLSLAGAAKQGLDPAELKKADRRFLAIPQLLSVLVLRHDRIVFERYYHGGTATRPQDVFSVTKSVVSTLVGIALAHGQLHSLDQKLVDFFPEKVRRDTDPRVRGIRLRDLLTMTAGYRESAIFSSDDWVDTLLNRPLASDPGETFSYDDGSAHLVSAILTQATGEPAETFARRELFAPLGIEPGRWTSDEQGHSDGSAGLFLRPHDLLELGQLFLHGGRSSGRQVVPAAWVRDSTKTQVAIPGGYAYGYFWWVNTGTDGGFEALGYAGQIVAVFPRLDLVIVTTSTDDFDRSAVLRRLLRAVSR